MTTAITGLTAGTWTIDTTHSTVGFSVRHLMVSKVRGRFTEFSGKLVIAEDGSASAEAEIQVDSVTTDNEQRDAHLRTADFFDVENKPEITFHSTSIQLGGGEGTITGELTINGVTRTVELDTEFNGVVVDAFETTRAGFEATTTISRKDFGLTWNAAIEAGGVLVSDKVVLNLDVAFTAPQA